MRASSGPALPVFQRGVERGAAHVGQFAARPPAELLERLLEPDPRGAQQLRPLLRLRLGGRLRDLAARRFHRLRDRLGERIARERRQEVVGTLPTDQSARRWEADVGRAVRERGRRATQREFAEGGHGGGTQVDRAVVAHAARRGVGQPLPAGRLVAPHDDHRPERDRADDVRRVEAHLERPAVRAAARGRELPIRDEPVARRDGVWSNLDAANPRREQARAERRRVQSADLSRATGRADARARPTGRGPRPRRAGAGRSRVHRRARLRGRAASTKGRVPARRLGDRCAGGRALLHAGIGDGPAPARAMVGSACGHELRGTPRRCSACRRSAASAGADTRRLHGGSRRARPAGRDGAARSLARPAELGMTAKDADLGSLDLEGRREVAQTQIDGLHGIQLDGGIGRLDLTRHAAADAPALDARRHG